MIDTAQAAYILIAVGLCVAGAAWMQRRAKPNDPAIGVLILLAGAMLAGGFVLALWEYAR